MVIFNCFKFIFGEKRRGGAYRPILQVTEDRTSLAAHGTHGTPGTPGTPTRDIDSMLGAGWGSIRKWQWACFFFRRFHDNYVRFVIYDVYIFL